MTVCIATVCENGATENSQKIIMCADRQISAGINFESGVSKIKSLNDYCFVMMSSEDSLKTDMIVQSVKNAIAGKRLKIEEIVKIFSNKYEELINVNREKAILSKFGLTYKEFVNQSKEINPDLLRKLSDSLINYKPEFESEIIVLGLEPEPHIYVLDELGNYTCYDFLGFATVGSGYTLAFPEMTKYEPQHNSNASLSTSLIRTYCAKKVAQRVGGVGPFTDLVVLHIVDNKIAIWPATPEAIKVLEDNIERIRKKESEIINESILELDKIFAKKVEEKIPKESEVKQN